ncbi:MAG: MFS transporter, partial [Bacteroidaceae bacterium]|nr:MFS transporter [Bacteroidaceae bacterium]
MEKKIGILLPLTLGLLSAFGPFITDFYLPALPEMTDYFGTSPSMVQMSLTTSVTGLAIGQLIIGPLSDKYGRKTLLLGSLLLFTIATIFCLFSTDILTFNICRVLQGFGGAGGIVLSKSISTDMFT